MFNKFVTICALHMSNCSGGPPPTSGKFFYVDISNFEQDNLIGVTLGHQTKEDDHSTFVLQLDTEDGALAIMDDSCRKASCGIQKKYSANKSKNWSAGAGTSVKLPDWLNMYDDRKTGLTPYEFTGVFDQDQFRLQYTAQSREITIPKTTFGRLTSVRNAATSTDAYRSLYSGYFGLAPFMKDSSSGGTGRNFLYQLIAANLIDVQVVALYVDAECKTEKPCSHMKLGSYDPINIKAGETLKLLKPATYSTWDLKTNIFKVGDTSSSLGDYKARIAPQLPYLYLPSAQWRAFASKLNEVFGTEICSTTTQVCKISQNCESVPKKDLEISFRLYDVSKNFHLVIDFEQMLVPGTAFGDGRNTCHFAVYDHQLRVGYEKRVFFIGTRYFSKYYIVYHQEQGALVPTIQLGIALKNTDNLSGKQHYDTDSEGFKPEPEQNDSSVVMTGVEDQYQKVTRIAEEVERQRKIDELQKAQQEAAAKKKADEEAARIKEEEEQAKLQKQAEEDAEKARLAEIEAKRIADEIAKKEKEEADAKAQKEKEEADAQAQKEKDDLIKKLQDEKEALEKQQREQAEAARLAKLKAEEEEAARQKQIKEDYEKRMQEIADREQAANEALAKLEKEKSEQEAKDKADRLQRESDAKKEAEERAKRDAEAKEKADKEAKEILDKAEADKKKAEKDAAEALQRQKELEEAAAKKDKEAADMIEKLRKDMIEAEQKQRVAEESAAEAQREREAQQKEYERGDAAARNRIKELEELAKNDTDGSIAQQLANEKEKQKLIDQHLNALQLERNIAEAKAKEASNNSEALEQAHAEAELKEKIRQQQLQDLNMESAKKLAELQHALEDAVTKRDLAEKAAEAQKKIQDAGNLSRDEALKELAALKKKNEERDRQQAETEKHPTEEKGDVMVVAIIAGSAVIVLLLVFLIVRCGKPKIQIVQKDDNVFCPEDVIDFDGDNSLKNRKEKMLTSACGIN